MKLFRQEAIDNKVRAFAGEPMLPTSISHTIILSVCATFAVAGLIFAYNFKFPVYSSGIGWLTPERGILKINTRSGGLIENMSIKNGQHLQSGDLIARVALNGSSIPFEKYENLKRINEVKEKANFAKNITEKENIESELIELNNKKISIENQLKVVINKKDIQLQIINMIDQDINRIKNLVEKGYASSKSYNEYVSRKLYAESELSSLQNQENSLNENLNSTLNKIFYSNKKLSSMGLALNSAKAEASERNLYFNAQNIEEIRAPFPGTVFKLNSREGEVVRAGSTVSILVPSEGPAVAEIYLRSKDIGRVVVGQKVRLRYDAFAYQKYGIGEGVVSSVSPSSVLQSEVYGPTPNTNEPIYIVIVKIDNATDYQRQNKVKLPLGSSLTAQILTGKKTFVEWVIDPIVHKMKSAN